MRALCFAAVLAISVSMSFLQLGFVSIAPFGARLCYAMGLLIPIVVGSLLLGAWLGALGGLLSAVAMCVHAWLEPLNIVEKCLVLIVPPVFVALFTLVGLVAGLLFSVALRNEPSGINRHLAEYLAELLLIYIPGSQDAGHIFREIHDSRLETDAHFSAVNDHIDPAVKVLHDVLRPGRAGPAGGIGARRGDVPSAAADQLQGSLMGRHSNSHGLKASCRLKRNFPVLLKDHGKRPRPEGRSQLFGGRRDLQRDLLQAVKLRNMNDQRIIGRASFRRVDLF
jgi:hypothetical protein